MTLNHSILLNKVVKAFPQEWPSLIPVVEFLLHTAPQGDHGLSAHDMSCGYGLLSPADSKVAPFMVPKGIAETDVAAKVWNIYALQPRASLGSAVPLKQK